MSPRPPGAVRVRTARREDAGAVADLEAECLGEDAWSPGLVAEVVAGTLPTVHAVVAVLADGAAQDVVVGYVGLSAVEEVSELQRLAVSPEHRRRGLASALVDAAVDLAVAAGAERLLLEVREDNDGARAFYAAAGFVELARRPRYYRDGSAAVVLERAVGPSGPETKACTRS